MENNKKESTKDYLGKLANQVPENSRRDFLKQGVKFSAGLAATVASGA